MTEKAIVICKVTLRKEDVRDFRKELHDWLMGHRIGLDRIEIEGMTHCPQCKKDYEPDFPERMLSAEPYQNEQHKLGYCSDKCFDEAISGSRPEYTYDEKGRRFEDGERKLFADPPR